MSTLTVTSLVLGIAIALGCGWYCRELAGRKGRDPLRWTLLGLVLNVVAVPLLMALPERAGSDGDD